MTAGILSSTCGEEILVGKPFTRHNLMSLGSMKSTPPIQPAPPPPSYCTGCGALVEPYCWECPNCGRRLHQSDGMQDSRPIQSDVLEVDPQVAAESKPHRKIPNYTFGAKVFAFIGVSAFFVLRDLIRNHFDFSSIGITGSMPIWVASCVSLVVLLWVSGFFDSDGPD